MTKEELNDTLESIRGKNNYRPDALGTYDAFWPSERHAETLDCRDFTQYDDPKD